MAVHLGQDYEANLRYVKNNLWHSAGQLFRETGKLISGQKEINHWCKLGNGGGKKSIHFNGSHDNIELLLRTVISANQLSVYGAIADFCDEVPKGIGSPVKPAAPDHLEKMEIPTDLSIAKKNPTNTQQRRNKPSARTRAKFEQVSEDLKQSKLCSDAGLKLVERGPYYFFSLDTEEGQEMQHLCREYTTPRNEKKVV